MGLATIGWVLWRDCERKLSLTNASSEDFGGERIALVFLDLLWS